MNYSSYITSIGDMLQYVVNDPTSATPFVNNDINNILPDMIQYAELRMYREFDFISTVVTSATDCVPNTRNVTMPSNLIILQSANVITPAVTLPDAGTRNPLQRVSIEYMNYTWPVASMTGVPEQYALNQDSLTLTALPDIRLAPTPDVAYKLECLGTARPAPLSSTNTQTFLTLNMADMFLSASLIFGSGFQQNYGQQADDPNLAPSWEDIYQKQKAGAMVEELRKKAQSTQWQPYLPSPLAPRGN